jgi:glycosyltransferase involved in cell wall biosynthesis
MQGGEAERGGSPPFVSVVMPAYNRAELARRALEPLLAQTYPRERYEIIVVDDGSTDDLAERVSALAEGWSGAFRLVRQANGGPASARNAGLRAARGELVAFVDADCVASQDWLEGVVGRLVVTGADGVGGPIVNVVGRGAVSRYLGACQFFRHRTRHGRVDYLLTQNIVVRRAALLDVGGFVEREGARAPGAEDADLSFRLIERGYTLLLADRGAVTHYGAPASVPALIRELYRYGRGSYAFSRDWRKRRSPLVELARHGAAVPLAPWLALRAARRVGLGWAPVFWPLVMIEHLAFMAGLVGGMAAAARRRGTKQPGRRLA